MSTRRTVAMLAASIVLTGVFAASAHADITPPPTGGDDGPAADSCVRKAPLGDPDDPLSGLCAIPRLGLTETSEERPPCDSCEHGGGTIIDGIDKNGLGYKEGLRKHDTILGLANTKGNDASALLTDPDALIAELAEHKEGEKLRLYVYSNEAGKYEVCSLTLGPAG